jgi:hypothetical protein
MNDANMYLHSKNRISEIDQKLLENAGNYCKKTGYCESVTSFSNQFFCSNFWSISEILFLLCRYILASFIQIFSYFWVPNYICYLRFMKSAVMWPQQHYLWVTLISITWQTAVHRHHWKWCSQTSSYICYLHAKCRFYSSSSLDTIDICSQIRSSAW